MYLDTKEVPYLNWEVWEQVDELVDVLNLLDPCWVDEMILDKNFMDCLDI